MRLNKYIAHATGVSRREADEIIDSGRATVNGVKARLGEPVNDDDKIKVDDQPISLPQSFTYLLVNKPVGYISTRKPQDETPTVYALLPEKFHRLKYVGRLDKDSSGLLLLTDDGDFAHQMTHPRYVKTKVYELTVNSPLSKDAVEQLETGVELEDGVSKLHVLEKNGRKLTVEMHEGRNRQIRRTIAHLGYDVLQLHRTKFGPYELNNLKSGEFIEVKKLEV